MNEIYWITRMDLISGWLIAIASVCGALLIVSFIVCLVNNYCSKTDIYESDRHDAKVAYEIWIPVRKWSTCLFVLFLPLAILTPNTKDTLLICGVGGTIDYLKTNEVVNQLPDKCVNAINAWVESLNKEDKIE